MQCKMSCFIARAFFLSQSERDYISTVTSSIPFSIGMLAIWKSKNSDVGLSHVTIFKCLKYVAAFADEGSLRIVFSMSFLLIARLSDMSRMRARCTAQRPKRSRSKFDRHNDSLYSPKDCKNVAYPNEVRPLVSITFKKLPHGNEGINRFIFNSAAGNKNMAMGAEIEEKMQ